jgi:CheY-like chemotaxis protein
MSGNVLVVDDDDALAENVAEILEILGVETAVARDRKTALALVNARDFDVALIDVRLPDGDGMSLLEPLRARSHFIQLVLVTGNATLEGAIAAVRGDAFAYVLPRTSWTRSGGRWSKRGSIGNGSVCGSTSNARSAAIGSWSSRCRPSFWPSTSGGGSRPGIGSSNG